MSAGVNTDMPRGSAALPANTVRIAPLSPALLTVADAAERLGVHPRTVHDYLNQGIIPCVVLPPRAGHDGTGKTARRRIVRIHTEDLNAFMHACRVGGEDAVQKHGAPCAASSEPESISEIIARLGEEYCPA